MSDARRGVLFGAAYYPEYQPSPDLEHDLDLMVDAGFTVIRVGESVWSTWEPEDGVFDLDWLQPVLDGAHARGIHVVLGTPTYAIPMWLARKHPEIAAETSTGHRRGWGARQEMDFTHSAYRFHAERIIRAVVGRYAGHPAIIGYQVDNEPGPQLLFNEGVFQGFVDRLRHEHGTVEALNEAWGLVYWSHRLSTWADLWRPDGNFQPQYDLAWRRYQADLVTEFIGWQTDIVHSLAGPDVFVTTCISYEQPAVEDADISARLDVASGNAYYEMADSLAHPSSAPRSTGPMGWVVRGAWGVVQLADLMWSSKQAPFLVTETNAGAIGFSAMNESPYDGQWRQAAWLLVGRGARMIEYWHWNTLPSGAETHWGGVLPHSGEPGRTYRELARLGGDLARAGEAFTGAEPEHDVTVLWDSDSKFALGPQSPFTAPGAMFDADGYRRIVSAFSRGVFDADRQSRIVRPQQMLPSRGADVPVEQLVREHPVLVVAGLLIASDEDLDLLAAYARAGGHLVLGPRTGAGDLEARARQEPRPGRLADVAGVWTEESANLAAPVPVSGAVGGAATDLLELLIPDGADVVARAEHPHLGRFAAITTRAVEAGRITVVGTVPDQMLAASLVRSWAPAAVSGWSDLPDSVTVSTSRTSTDRLHVLHNWGWEPATAVAPVPLMDLLTGDAVAVGEPVRLGPWDVRVLRSSLDEGTS